MLLGDILRRCAKLYPAKTALVFEDRRIDFAQLYARSNKLATALTRLGVNKGDRVAILEENTPEGAELVFATGAGFVAVPLNYRLAASDFAYMIDDVGANTLLVGEKYIGQINSIRDRIPSVRNYISVGPGTHEGMLRYADLLGSVADHDRGPAEAAQGDLAVILYTSGTTGPAKGVMLTHKSLLASQVNYIIARCGRHEDVEFLGLPLCHVGGICHLMTNFYLGSTIVMTRRWDTEQFLELAVREKVTNFAPTPYLLNTILHHPRLSEFRSQLALRLIQVSGGAMPVEQIKATFALLNCELMVFYALTEASPMVTFLPPAELKEAYRRNSSRMSSAGREYYNTRIRVVDDDGRDVSPGQAGEIIVRGDNVMRGYWNKPQETQKTVVDGWLHTGDVARIDEEGYVTIVDRKKDIIRTASESVSPFEVEEVIMGHPSVDSACVIGIPDHKWGEMVVAVVLPKEGESVQSRDIIDHCKKQLAGFKCPKEVKIASADFPCTASGKIMRRKVKEAYLAGKAQ